jgi:hypothetical protein
MQNKLVRIALERLRLSIKEFLVELPPEMNHAYEDAISPEGANPPRIFIPTRPSLLKPGDSLRIFRMERIRCLSRRTRSLRCKTGSLRGRRWRYRILRNSTG